MFTKIKRAVYAPTVPPIPVICEPVHFRNEEKSKFPREREKGEINIKLFGLISIFDSVTISATRSILPITVSSSFNILHYKEKSIS